MSEYPQTRKQKISYWWFCNNALILMIITSVLMVYDVFPVLTSIFTLDFIFNPNHIVHNVWHWYITIPLGIAWMFFFMRWLGPSPF
uniref:ORF54 n=1 Tax=Nitrosopumilaceae spindle-shaped virus TaxID=3065433 RepID=A0AAT9JA88_9VIRU